MNKITLIFILFSFQLCIGQNIIKKETIETYKGLNKFGKIEKGNLLYKSTSFYDKRGNIITYISKSNDPNEINSTTKETTKFDIKNNPIEKNSYNSRGSLIQKWIFKYDKNGNEIEEFLYKNDGSLNMKWKYKYNDKGKKIEQLRFDTDGTQKNVFYYNSKGTIELEKRYQNDKLFNYTKSINDDKGNIIKSVTYNAENKLISTDSKKYDLKGNLLEVLTDSSYNNKVFKYSYTYSQFNKLGKWAKKISYTNDEIDTIEIKTFEYY